MFDQFMTTDDFDFTGRLRCLQIRYKAKLQLRGLQTMTGDGDEVVIAAYEIDWKRQTMKQEA